MSGRGAWNVAGLGGTKKYKDQSKPGPYYFIGTGAKPADGTRDVNEYAVWRAVMAYQRAANRRMKTSLRIDGLYGPITAGVILDFQEDNIAETGTPWGGIGPQTSEALLMPDLRRIVKNAETRVTVEMVSGTVRHESNWDAGAVGYVDDRDVGLAQINATAHPDWSTAKRLQPLPCFQFIIDYYENALAQLNGNIRDSVASYNLGIGGARSWIKAGRPDEWTPAGSTTPRDVKGYIDSILAG